MTIDWTAEFPWLTQDLARVKQTMKDSLDVGEREPYAKAQHLIEYSGHLFRPRLTLLVSYMGHEGPATEDAVTAAAVVELLHVAALYHDDVMDGAVLRRGKETLNARHGQKTAILAGDYLLASCMELAASLGALVASTVAAALKEVCRGQLQETADIRNALRTEESYFVAIGGKTASLLGLSAALGGQSGNLPQAVWEAMRAYVYELGIAFQISDDIKDIRASIDNCEKSGGKDLQNGIYTLPVICGMRRVPDELSELLDAYPLTATRQSHIQALLESSGSIREATDVARRHVVAAHTQLDQVSEKWLARGHRKRLAGVAELLVPDVVQDVSSVN